MPSNRPRYTVTELLFRLASAGARAVGRDVDEPERRARRERQQQALRRSDELVDVDALLSDAAWR